MTLQNLTNSIKRECLANPKKGAVLALLLVAGLYFWGPILKRWTFGATKPAATTTEETVIAQDDPRPEQPATPAVKLPAWDKIELALEKSEHAQPMPANQAALLKNPFVKLAFENAEAKIPGQEDEGPAEKPMVVPAVQHIDPAQVGLIVKSVSIGPGGRLATFRGQVYSLGDQIPVSPDDAPPTNVTAPITSAAPFELTKVEPWGVVLTRNGKEYIQQLAQPRLKKFDRIAWGGGSDDSSPDDAE